MEIIHLVLGKANPDRMNGVNKVVCQLAAHQHRQGRNVAIWGITKNLSRNFGERPFQTELFPAASQPFAISKPLRNAIEKKARQKTVFHLHGGWIPVYATLARLFNRLDIRFVITGHGAYNTMAMQRSKWLKKTYFALFEKPMLRNAWKIHSIGESEVRGLQTIYPNNKNFLLPYGFEFKPTNNARTPNPEGFTIGFMGRLDTRTKGLDLLIRAFHEFQNTDSDSILWIIGDGPGKADMEKFIAANKVKNVVFWGSKFGREKENLVSQLHVFVHPSRNEGLPASVLEAAASQVPVIVSEPTNVAAQVRRYNAGTAIVHNNVNDLAEAFIQLRQTDEQTMKTISANASAMVREAFSWDRLVDNFDLLYS